MKLEIGHIEAYFLETPEDGVATFWPYPTGGVAITSNTVITKRELPTLISFLTSVLKTQDDEKITKNPLTGG
tara:strand:+ start:1056 stop:1271 length:216 start_codon:yes stop_codon:yes gene_type:complete